MRSPPEFSEVAEGGNCQSLTGWMSNPAYTIARGGFIVGKTGRLRDPGPRLGVQPIGPESVGPPVLGFSVY